MTAPEHSSSPEGWPTRLLFLRDKRSSSQPENLDESDLEPDTAATAEALDGHAESDGPSAMSDLPDAGAGVDGAPGGILASDAGEAPEAKATPRDEEAPAQEVAAGDDAPDAVVAAGSGQDPDALIVRSESADLHGVELPYQDALAELRAFPSRYLTLLRTRSEVLTLRLKREAEADEARIRQNAAIAIDRIEQRAVADVEARHAALAASLEAEQQRLARDLVGAENVVATFESRLVALEGEMTVFFDRLQVDDLAPIGSAEGSSGSPSAGATLQEDPARGDEIEDGGSVEDSPIDDGEPKAASPATSEPDFAGQHGTTITVKGLPEVTQMASFMRQLRRLPGAESVQVRAEPNGEVTFALTHEPDMDVRKAVSGLSQFHVQVVSEGPGELTVDVVDPKANPDLHELAGASSATSAD